MTNLRANPAGDRPRVDPSAWVDPSAQVIGNVRLGARVFVGPGAVLRADETGPDGAVAAVDLGEDGNVQDGAVVHALGGTPVAVGPRTSLSHGCIVHGPARIGAGCFVGFRAVVFDAALGNGVLVGAGAVVQGVRIEAGTLVPPRSAVLTAADAAALGRTGPAEREFMEKVLAANRRLVEGYRRASP